MAYAKLSTSILDSTIWREDNQTRIVWLTMLAMANQDGEVAASIPGLADRARVSVEECKKALETFQAPDEYSRSKKYEGRRIAAVDGGWLVLNYEKYRDLQSAEERREKDAARQQRRRDRKREQEAAQAALTVTLAEVPLTTRDQVVTGDRHGLSRPVTHVTPSGSGSGSNSTSTQTNQPVDRLDGVVITKEKTEPLAEKEGETPEETAIRGVFQSWYSKRPTFKGSPIKENYSTFQTHWKASNVDLDAFRQAVIWRLHRFDQDGRSNASNYLGSLSKFLIDRKWEDETAPIPSKPARHGIDENYPDIRDFE